MDARLSRINQLIEDNASVIAGMRDQEFNTFAEGMMHLLSEAYDHGYSQAVQDLRDKYN